MAEGIAPLYILIAIRDLKLSLDLVSRQTMPVVRKTCSLRLVARGIRRRCQSLDEVKKMPKTTVSGRLKGISRSRPAGVPSGDDAE